MGAAYPRHKRALITGITGQDGSYLAELLLDKGYEVYGLVRRTSDANISRIAHIIGCIDLIQGDLLDQSSLAEALQIADPDEIYNLASMSHVGTSFSQPIATGEITGLGAVRLLEALRFSGIQARFYQASTSEIIGQADQTIFRPRSPYGIAKLYAHQSVVNYREAYDMYACNGILYNHESPRRGLDFVTRKITRGVARIAAGLQQQIPLGNLHIKRDWGYAGDYVKAMWLMLQRETPKDYVIATGEAHSLQEFVTVALQAAGLSGSWSNYVTSDVSCMRPADVEFLRGDASEACRELEWRPRVSFEQLVAMMVEQDLEEVMPRATGIRQIEESHLA